MAELCKIRARVACWAEMAFRAAATETKKCLRPVLGAIFLSKFPYCFPLKPFNVIYMAPYFFLNFFFAFFTLNTLSYNHTILSVLPSFLLL